MKWFAFLAICLAFCSASVQAETVYVKDRFEITLRTGPGTNRKIVSILKSDQQVETLDQKQDWTKVRLSNGKEGWVVSRYLTPKLPNRIVLEQLQSKHDTLKTRANSLFKENQKHQDENKRLKTALTGSQEDLNKLKKSYETLKMESAKFLSLKSNYEKTSAELVHQTQKADALEEELTKLQWNKNIKWFLSGAGVLIVGYIIGFSSKRQRRRSSLL